MRGAGHLSQCTSYDRFNDCAAIVVEQVDLVDDEQLHLLWQI